MSYIHVTEGLYTRDGNINPEYNNNQKSKELLLCDVSVSKTIFNVQFSHKKLNN